MNNQDKTRPGLSPSIELDSEAPEASTNWPASKEMQLSSSRAIELGPDDSCGTPTLLPYSQSELIDAPSMWKEDDDSFTISMFATDKTVSKHGATRNKVCSVIAQPNCYTS